MLQARLSQEQAFRMILQKEVLQSIPNQAVRPRDTKAAQKGVRATIKRLLTGHGKD